MMDMCRERKRKGKVSVEVEETVWNILCDENLEATTTPLHLESCVFHLITSLANIQMNFCVQS